MKDEAGSVAIKKIDVLKAKTYSFLGDDNNENKKAMGVNENVEKITHIEYKDVLLNKKCLRHSMN